MLLHQSLELNCLRKFGSMKAVNLCGLFKVSFYQEISVFAQQKSGQREWKENMKELQITLTLKSQVKKILWCIKSTSSYKHFYFLLNFQAHKTNEHWRENGSSPLDTHLLAALTAADTLPHSYCCSHGTKVHAAQTLSANLFHIFLESSWGWFLKKN